MSTSFLLVAVVISAVGLGYLMYGRRQRRGMPFIAGLGLVFAPHLIDSLMLTVLVGAGLAALPFVVKL